MAVRREMLGEGTYTITTFYLIVLIVNEFIIINLDDVVCINNEATNGIVYTPTGVCGETFTLNNGG
jgi:hypothetical protein